MRRWRPTRACSRFHGTAIRRWLWFSRTHAPKAAAVVAAFSDRSLPPHTSAAGHANAEELGAILDTTAEGIVMFDAEGTVTSMQPQREALVRLWMARNRQLQSVAAVAPESQPCGADLSEGHQGRRCREPLDNRRDVLGPRAQRAHHPAVDDLDEPGPTPEFLRVFRELFRRAEQAR